MKCVLCNQTLKGKRDLERHADVKHKLTMKQYHLAAGAVQEAYGGLEAFNRAMKMTGLVLMLFALAGCHSRGLDRLLGNTDPGTPYVPPHGPAADANATPVYDQATATPAQDENLIRHVIGDPSSSNFHTYVNEAWLPDRMNGIDNSMPGTGTSSILVDAWKALYRRGYADVSKLKDPGVLASNVYPIPVYQDDRTRWGV